MKRVIAPLRDFLHRESASGVLILLSAALGLLVANSPLADNYFNALDAKFRIGIDPILVDLSVVKFINYVLMTIFFFVVGLEIKRELTTGHLSTRKKALMPFVAALGGMAVPAFIYLAIAGSTDANGWGVPVATDIALAVGLLAMVGTSAVASLRAFLLALAVIDDIGAILIIAFVYSSGVLFSWLFAGLAMVVGILVLQKVKVTSTFVYVVLGMGLWFALYKSGVHPTLAGVILGLLTPNLQKQNSGLEDEVDGSVSVIEWLENKLHPWSTFMIVPLFAFANTGVEISRESIDAALNSQIAWGIFAGLVIGKPLGIFTTIYAGKKIKVGEVPEGARPLSILATGSAAGIGFTVAIFIANLAFSEPATQDLAIVAVIAASIASGVLSYVLFKLLSKRA
ncbi:MAG: Na+/H+ antiporter NhaA [Actinobacteria bacterium]|jgi:NhaA family Na+:H+ antiporter|nr:Na+/H+ antiporter NhaA [Actinomycetota bacterium]